VKVGIGFGSGGLFDGFKIYGFASNFVRIVHTVSTNWGLIVFCPLYDLCEISNGNFFIPNHFYGKCRSITSDVLPSCTTKNSILYILVLVTVLRGAEDLFEIRRIEVYAKNTPEWLQADMSNQLHFELNTG
jgi:hypothetical protein